jgi:hypothetical protein
MNENETQFLIDFLSNKYLRGAERKKALELAFKELEENSISMTEKKELRGYLMEAAGRIKKSDEPAVQSEIDSKDRYRDPKGTLLFLRELNKDPILKYTCHTIDSEHALNTICEKAEISTYSFEAHRKLIKTSFFELNRKYQPAFYLYSLIKAYLIGGNEWSADEIKYNWHSPDLLDWSVTNPGCVPNPGDNMMNKLKNEGFEFRSFVSKSTGKRVQSFSDLTIHFKHLFHVRHDNSLRDLTNRINTKEGFAGRANIQHDDYFNDKIELFTDVDKLLQAYASLINLTIEVDKSNTPLIKLSFEERGSNKVFGIHHLNSEYSHTVSDTVKRPGETYGSVTNLINGLCDFYLLADFGRKEFAKVNIWNGEDRAATVMDEFKGVKYEFIFTG